MAGSPSRMLKLLSLLQTRRDWPGPVLAERLEISDRTLRRDVDHLRELGYRISAIKGPDGGYRLDAGSALPPLLFDDDQAVALAIALQIAAATGATDGESALRALSTVRQVMPSHLRHRIDSVAFTTLPAADGAESTVDPDILIAVSGAVRSREILRFDYASVGSTANSEPSRKRVEPHHVVFSNGRWYLIAWDSDIDQWRVFRVDRMVPRVPTGPRFTPRTVPGGDVHEFLAARFKGSDGGNRWPCNGDAVLGLPIRRVIPFMQDGSAEELTPEQCRITIGSWSWVALAAAIARYDAPISEVRPRELADAFGLLAQRLTAATQTLPPG